MDGEKRKTTLAHLGMVLTVVIWGITPLIGKFIMNKGYDSPALLIGVRALISAVVLAIFLLVTGRFKKLNKGYLLCIPAGLIMGGAYIFQFIGLESTSLSKNTFLESFSVIAVPLAMLVFARAKPPLLSLLASLGCLVGAFILCGKGFDFSGFFTAPSMGDIFSAIGGFLFGVNIAFAKVFSKDKDPYIYVFFQMVVTAALSFGYAIPFEKDLAFAWNFENIGLVLVLALICTVACWLLRTICIKRVSAVTCAVLNPMSAVIATSLSMGLQMEEFSWNVILGGAIIFIAIILSGLADIHAEKKSPGPPSEPEPSSSS